MDDSKNAIQVFLSFPPEIWASITSKLPVEQIGRLKMTGSKFLWSKLVASNAVESIKLENDFSGFKKWPAFLDELTSVKELSIYTQIYQWWQLLDPKLDKMPKTLRKLEIQAPDVCLVSFFSRNGMKLSLREHLPCLEYLGLSMNWSRDHHWTSQVPENLLFLRCTRWDGSALLPASLMHFKANFIELDEGTTVSIPPHLISIETNCMSRSLVKQLPSTLASLIQRENTGPNNMKPENIQQLPKSLTRLQTFLHIEHIRQLKFSSAQTIPEDLFEWPPQLSDLTIAYLPSECWSYLPSTIKWLELERLDAMHLTLTKTVNDPLTGQTHQFKTLPIDKIPKSVTYLTILIGEEHRAPVYLDCDEIVENDPKILLSSDSSSVDIDSKPETSSSILDPKKHAKSTLSRNGIVTNGCFPPGLTYLELGKIQLSVNAARQLPSSLTSLKLHNLDEHVCEHLPRGLVQLRTTNTILSLNLIKHLPPSLTELDLRFLIISTVINPQTGRPEKLDKIKFYEKRIEHTNISSSVAKSLWQGVYSLPPHLKKLHLANFLALSDKILNEQLKNATILDFACTTSFTDSSILKLPPRLTHLYLNSAKKITGKCFVHLPRCLILLNLGASSEISDSHIRYLPPGLCHLILDSTKRLTNDCGVHLPRSLTFLSLGQCSKITPEILPHLPYPLRYSVLSFFTSKWILSRGEFSERTELKSTKFSFSSVH